MGSLHLKSTPHDFPHFRVVLKHSCDLISVEMAPSGALRCAASFSRSGEVADQGRVASIRLNGSIAESYRTFARNPSTDFERV